MRDFTIITAIVLYLIIPLKSFGQYNPNDVYLHKPDLDKGHKETFYENQKRIQSLVGRTGEETARNIDAYLSSINDVNNLGKLTAYDAGPNGANLERFLNSPCYETIGFSPSTDRNDLEEQYKICEAGKNKSFYYKVGFIALFILVTLLSLFFGVRPSLNMRKSNNRMHSFSNSNLLNTNERLHNYDTIIKNDKTAVYQKTAMGNWLNEKLTSNQKYFLYAFIVMVGIPILLLVLKLLLL